MSHATVPEEVLRAVIETPAMWPAILEWSRWFRDARTGRIEIIFGGTGGVKDMLRHEHLAQGQSIALPAGMEPICPGCRGPVVEHDYGNKVYCARCDRTVTIWEIKAGKFYRPTTHEPSTGS